MSRHRVGVLSNRNGDTHSPSAQGVNPDPPERWSRRVSATSNALDLEPGMFTWDDPRLIAATLKRSAEGSQRRKGNPFAIGDGDAHLLHPSCWK